MTAYRLIELPAFVVLGKKTWISGQDNDIFGRFWEQCRSSGLFQQFKALGGFRPGPCTGGVTLGISRVEKDPANRDFFYMIAIEKPRDAAQGDLEEYEVPAGLWAVFECRGKIPDALVEAEIFAITQWLPNSDYAHALAPEMEVYPPGEGGPEVYCEFWLPIEKKERSDDRR
jgi:AraC family transcriptional regulator